MKKNILILVSIIIIGSLVYLNLRSDPNSKVFKDTNPTEQVSQDDDTSDKKTMSSLKLSNAFKVIENDTSSSKLDFYYSDSGCDYLFKESFDPTSHLRVSFEEDENSNGSFKVICRIVNEQKTEGTSIANLQPTDHRAGVKFVNHSPGHGLLIFGEDDTRDSIISGTGVEIDTGLTYYIFVSDNEIIIMNADTTYELNNNLKNLC